MRRKKKGKCLDKGNEMFIMHFAFLWDLELCVCLATEAQPKFLLGLLSLSIAVLVSSAAILFSQDKVKQINKQIISYGFDKNNQKYSFLEVAVHVIGYIACYLSILFSSNF